MSDYGICASRELSELSRSVWENLDLGRVQTSLCSVCTNDRGQDFPIQTSCSVNKNYASTKATHQIKQSKTKRR